MKRLTFVSEADFRQERDFGAKIGATFEFLAAHGRPLGKCLLYFVLPPSLLMGLGLGIAQSNGLDQLPQSNTSSMWTKVVQAGQVMDIGVSYWLGMLSMGVAYVLLAATLYGYVQVRMALPPEQQVTPAHVGAQIRRYALRLVLSSVVWGLAIMVGLMLFVIPGLYLMVALMVVWPVLVFEDRGADQAFSRSLTLVRGKWWSTLGLYFMMSLVATVLGVVLTTPQYALMAGKVLLPGWFDSAVFSIGAGLLANTGQILLYTPLLIALMFQYFNLVERKEGLGLRSLVASLGTGPAPVAQQHAYQPDDDGEY